MQMAEKYRLPRIELTDGAKLMLMKYKWPGNIRQLKHITEQMSVLCRERMVPKCGSTNIDKLQRITGYLVGTTDRWNSGKLAELNDRVTHIDHGSQDLFSVDS